MLLVSKTWAVMGDGVRSPMEVLLAGSMEDTSQKVHVTNLITVRNPHIVIHPKRKPFKYLKLAGVRVWLSVKISSFVKMRTTIANPLSARSLSIQNTPAIVTCIKDAPIFPQKTGESHIIMTNG